MLQIITNNQNKSKAVKNNILLLFIALFLASNIPVQAEDAQTENQYPDPDLYEKSLFLQDTKDSDAQPKSHDDVQDMRKSLYKYVVLEGLSGGDVGFKSSDELIAASAELQSSASEEKTENERLAEVTRGHALIVEALAQQNQLLARLLQMQSMYVLRSGLSVYD